MYAENLKKVRKSLNLSVDKFAQKLGIPASTIWGYEGKKESLQLSYLSNCIRFLMLT